MKHEGYTSVSENKLPNAILVCSPRGAVDAGDAAEGIVTSPLQCLDAASDGTFTHVFILFPQDTFKETDDLVELCRSLKHNSRTRKTPIVAVLRKRHEGLMTTLGKAGVEYLKIVESIRLDPGAFRGIAAEIRPDDLLGRTVSHFCPFLHFSRVNESLDMPVCGGYHDILVINDRRLRGLCADDRHESCEYFRNPRK